MPVSRFFLSALCPLLLALCLQLLTPRPLFASEPAKWAVIIAVATYRDSSKRLTGDPIVLADALSLKNTLVEAAHFPEGNIILLTTGVAAAPEQPTAGAIAQALDRLSARIEPGDTVFLYFSGRAVTISGISYLLPVEAEAVDAQTLADTSIDLTRFRQWVNAIPAGLLVIALDTGRGPADAITDLPGAKPGMTEIELPLEGKKGPKAVAVFYSCSPGQSATVSRELGRGYFALALEQGLRGKAADKEGAVTAARLGDYLQTTVPTRVKDQEKGQQVPRIQVQGEISAATTPLASSQKSVSSTLFTSASSTIRDTRAYLKLTLDPPDARFAIDGELRRNNPIVLDLGTDNEKVIELAVLADGYVPRVQKVTLIRGAMVPLTVTLTKKSKP